MVRSRLGQTFGLLLAGALIVTAAESGWAASSQSGATTVTFNIAESIEVTSWPASAFTLASTATPGVPVVSEVLSMTVRSNSVWGVQISSDSPDGRLREFDASVGAYSIDGKRAGPLEWAQTSSGPWTPLSSLPTTMYSGMPPTGAAGESVGFVLRVVPSYDDLPLASGREYRIVLTYTAGVGF